MSELEIGYTPYESVKNHAYWARVNIDTRLGRDTQDIDDYKAHLMDCEKNPTIGYLARRKYITGKPMNYPEYAKRNLHFMDKQPEIKALKESISKKINKKLYPRTKHIRKYIIDNERVVLDYVKKSKKYTIFNKLSIILRKFI